MKRQQQRIFAGGLNLLTPSDKTPESECIDLLNWRVDQAGVLRGGDSFSQLTSVAGLIHTVYRLDNFTTVEASYYGVQAINFGVNGAYLIGSGTVLNYYQPLTNYTAQIASGFSGQPLSIVIFNGYIWVLDSAKQVKIDPVALSTVVTGAVTAWLPASPASALTAALGAAGTGPGAGPAVQYFVTFVNRAGLETNPGPASAYLSGCDGVHQVNLTNIPISADSDVWKRRIYRVGGSLGEGYQVMEISNNTVTAAVDSFNDLTVTELGIQIPTTNDPPPTGGTFTGLVGPYFNRLLAWKDGRMFWSQDGIPLFPGSAATSATGNWVNVGSPDDKIQCITIHARVAGIYKQRSIWRLSGDAVTGYLDQSSAKAGALGKLAVAHGGQVDYVLSNDGLFSFDIDALTSHSDLIAPVFNNTTYAGRKWIQLGASDLAPVEFVPIPNASISPVCAFLNGNVLISDGYTGAAYLYNVATQRWARFQNNYYGGNITFAFSFGSAYHWYIGDAAGGFYGAVQASGITQQLVYQTPFLDQGLGDAPKQYQEFVLDAELNGASATLYALTNNSGTAGTRATVPYPFAQTFTGTNRQKIYFALSPDPTGTVTEDGTKGYPHISFRLELVCNSVGVPPAIHGMFLYWAELERDAASRGTQVLDFQNERVALCKRIEVDIVGQVNIVISTDQSGSLQPVYTRVGIPIAGRNTLTFNLPPNTRGRLWQFNILPQSPTARIYALRSWMRDVGNSTETPWEWRSILAGSVGTNPDAE